MNPQTEDGHTRIANTLFEAAIRAPLSIRQLKVFMAIIRKTYGFGKKMDRISNGQLAEITGIDEAHVCRTKNQLIAMNMVLRSGSSHGPIGPNKHYDKWCFDVGKEDKNKKIADGSNFADKHQKNHRDKENCSRGQKLPTGARKKLLTGAITKERESIKVEANASTSSTDVDGDAPLNGHKRTPPCPHDAILTLWAKHFPDKPQPKTWTGTRQTNLAARWRQGFAEKVRRGKRQGETFYADRDTGIDWWDRFFGYCAKQRFLRDGNFFVLDWVVKPSNFAKVLDGNYEGGKHD